MKVLLTGSHFSPAQAVIEELSGMEDLELVYLGRKYARDGDSAKSPESQIFPKLGVKFIPITAGKLNRFFSFQSVISLLKTPIGFLQAFYYLMKEQPDLIVSFGGFTGLPVVICGYLLSIPSIVHEQGLSLGVANFISAFFADKVAVSFEDFKIPAFLNSKKFTLTGNPVRKEFLSETAKPNTEIFKFIKSIKQDKPIVLITAGNQGSHKFNLLVEDTLTGLTGKAAVIHQTGDSKFEDFDNLKKFQSDNYLVKKWIEAKDLNFILNKSDLAVSRAGINTLSELAVKKVPSLMIPIPVGNEQKRNAKFFADLGLGETMDEKKITPVNFQEKIFSMLTNRKSHKKSAENPYRKIVLGGEKRIVQEILILLNYKQHPELSFK